MNYKWYGDEWLSLRNLFNSMSINEILGYQMVSNISLIPQNELVYLTGEKDHFKKSLGFFIGITRVLANDSTGKYKKLLEARKVFQRAPPQQDNYSHFS